MVTIKNTAKMTIFRNSIFVVLAGLLVSSCGMKSENEQLKAESDSLRAELETTTLAVQTLQQVGAWMDSIDSGRENLELSLERGIQSDDFVARMEAINQYVKDSENKIAELEANLSTTSNQSQAYASTIGRLRQQLQSKNDEVVSLQEQVTRYKVENQDLITAVTMREEEIMQKDTELEIKRQELELLENRIMGLFEAAKVNQADALFARGQAVEEAANRTRLAPKKKRETYLEALDLYRQASNLGHEEAKTKMEELQKILN